MAKVQGLLVEVSDTLNVIKQALKEPDISYNQEFLTDFHNISKVDARIVFGGEDYIEPDFTLPLFISGFSSIEIAYLRNVSRQLIMPKIKNQAAHLRVDMDKVKILNKKNRSKLHEVVARWYVRQTEISKDLSTLDPILNKTVKTNRTKYKIYAHLGGDIALIKPEEIDKRMVNYESDPIVVKVYGLFDKNLSNSNIAAELNIPLADVQHYRRNYFRRLSNMQELTGREVTSEDWVSQA